MTRDAAQIGIVGGGIVGLATAWALVSRGHRSLLVVEAEPRVAAHQTGNNSGVIHSGLYYKPGSLKARNCVTGREALYRFCQEHGVAHERCGKLVVATEPAEIPALEELIRRGTANGLANLRMLAAEELGRYEPHVRGVAGLWVEETGIVDFVGMSETLARLVREQGGRIETTARLLRVVPAEAEMVLETTAGTFRVRNLINCAGLHSDRVARMCGIEPGLQILPFRGEYYQLVAQRESLVRNLIYPVPDARFPFLGVHFTRMVKGGVEAGPNAVLALRRHGYRRGSISPTDALELARYSGMWRMARRYWRTGMMEMYRSYSKAAFVRSLQRLVPELRAGDLVPAGAGVRAQAVEPDGQLVDDFRIVDAERMIHVLNAPSPAATASLAIGATIADRAAGQFDLPA